MDWFKKWIPTSEDHEHELKGSTDKDYKEIHTKVAYRYPVSSLPNKPPEPRSLKRNGDVMTDRIVQSDEPEISEKREEIKERIKRLRRSKENVEVESVGEKLPFRPKQVPSPIFGYQSRKEEAEPVEYELTRFHIESSHKEENNKVFQAPADGLKPVISPDSTVFSDSRKILNRQSVSQKLPEKNEKGTIQYSDKKMETGTAGLAPLTNNQNQSSYRIVDNDSSNSNSELQSEINVKEDREAIIKGKERLKQKRKMKESGYARQTAEISHSKPANRTVPFNVLMLKKDRELLKKRNGQKQKTYHGHSQNITTPPFNDVPRQEENKQPAHSHDSKADQSSGRASYDTKADQSGGHVSYGLNADQNGGNVRAQLHFSKDTMDSHSPEERKYEFPELNMLKSPVRHTSNSEWIHNQANTLNQTLESFHVAAKVVAASEGPSVTRFEISPEMGVKVNKITSLSDDIKLNLAAKDIRIEAPIPGKHTVGIEVPNPAPRPVFLREVIASRDFYQSKSPLTAAVGLDISGKPIITDLKKMPHGLIAGATGSGKSVCINTFITSLLFKARPDQLKLLLIDPKMVELAPYNDLPHLISPVITNVQAATQALKWAVDEMERRYELFAGLGVRDIERYNEKNRETLPYIVIIIDELADLMMMSPADVEEAIVRIAQKARAAGIHLLIATQRPSVDVITGLIKANIPTRIAFSVSSQVDSRTILDLSGAERLLGKGDMLFHANGTSKPIRLQGCYISDEEIEKIVEHVRSQGKPVYVFQQEELIRKSDIEEYDDLLLEACEFAVQQGNISTSSLQRRFRIGYNRAARLIDLMESKGLITGQNGSKPRDVLINEQDLEKLKGFSI